MEWVGPVKVVISLGESRFMECISLEAHNIECEKGSKVLGDLFGAQGNLSEISLYLTTLHAGVNTAQSCHPVDSTEQAYHHRRDSNPPKMFHHPQI